VDAFIYYASMGLDMAQQKRSLQLFIDRVMPAFADKELVHAD
ncbi:MAG TPA: LLM class flavin-dependent oxidoreductase, partial [Roseovarius nubinhibens]|nr:LLM class flavin-dependent oxidoreductase [Roseovarius nubinhibens]